MWLLPKLGKQRTSGERTCCLYIVIAKMTKVVRQRNGPLGIGTFNEHEEGTRLDHSFSHYTAIPAGTSSCCDTVCQSVNTPTSFNFPARIAWSCYLNMRFANSVGI